MSTYLDAKYRVCTAPKSHSPLIGGNPPTTALYVVRLVTRSPQKKLFSVVTTHPLKEPKEAIAATETLGLLQELVDVGDRHHQRKTLTGAIARSQQTARAEVAVIK